MVIRVRLVKPVVAAGPLPSQPVPAHLVPNSRGKGGRPPLFLPTYYELALKYCMLVRNCTNEMLAKLFEVDVKTIEGWIQTDPKFSGALKEGKEYCDTHVAYGLYERAVGCSRPDVHISTYEGQVTITPITKIYPPDPGAAIQWLSNRRHPGWRRGDKEDTNTSPPDEAARKIREHLSSMDKVTIGD